MGELYANSGSHNDGVKLRFDTVCVCSMFCTGFVSNEVGQIWLYYTQIQVS